MLSLETTAEAQKFLEAFHVAQNGALKRLIMGKLRFLYYDPQWKEACRIAHVFAENYVDKALEFRKSFLVDGKSAIPGNQVDEKSYILLYEIAKQTGNRIELRNQILHIFMAAHDTTPITLSNAFLLLSRHQDKWEKLRKEVLANGSAPITYDLLKSLKYVRYVLNESMSRFTLITLFLY
jgi:cytochrome P450